MKKWLRDNRGFLLFLVLFGVFRTAVADWNPIPSGSMRPNLLEGDVVFINRLAYNVKLPLTDVVLAPLGEPKRGDIVTFSSPRDGTRLIKRVVGLPGDRVAMRDKRLLINGQAVEYVETAHVLEPIGNRAWPAVRLTEKLGETAHTVQWLAGTKHAAAFDAGVIPSGHYLMLGDNRDDGADSRYIGLVPRHLLVGRAERILVSAAIKENWGLRFERFGQTLK